MIDVFVPLMRPGKLPWLVDNIEETTPEPHRVQVVASRDLGIPPPWPRYSLWCDGGGTYADRINWLFRKTFSPYFFLGADDIRFHQGWLASALSAMGRVVGVVAVNDLHNPHGTHALVSRRYIEEFSGTMDEHGVVLHPGYRHNWCDTELFETARKRGRFAYCPESVVEHLHPAAGKAPQDEVYQLGLSSYPRDTTLHESRRGLWA